MKKIVLAYSGGLDTSIILRWLQDKYKSEVIAYTSDIGQVINRKKIIKNAKRLGVKNIIIENLKNVFVFDFYNDRRNDQIKIGFRFIFNSKNKTLTVDDVDKEIDDIVILCMEIGGVEVPGYSQ